MKKRNTLVAFNDTIIYSHYFEL